VYTLSLLFIITLSFHVDVLPVCLLFMCISCTCFSLPFYTVSLARMCNVYVCLRICVCVCILIGFLFDGVDSSCDDREGLGTKVPE
jgi:hypothetical protein